MMAVWLVTNYRLTTVECVWLVAGVKQPHLARVGLIGLGAGWGRTPVGHEQSSPQVKTATPTHTHTKD